MTLSAEKQIEHVGETSGCAEHDHDLIHELSKRLDSLWRFDQYIANAEKHEDLRGFWRELKQQEQQNVDRLKQLIRGEIQRDCF